MKPSFRGSFSFPHFPKCPSGPFPLRWLLAFRFKLALGLSFLIFGLRGDAPVCMLHLIPSATRSPLSCRMIAAVDTDSPREVFFRVASEMFSDGNFNWGRVVALFYFASKLVLKVGGCRAGSPGRLPSNPRGTGEVWRQPLWQPRRTEGDSYEPVVGSFIHVFIQQIFTGPTMCHPVLCTQDAAPNKVG